MAVKNMIVVKNVILMTGLFKFMRIMGYAIIVAGVKYIPKRAIISRIRVSGVIIKLIIAIFKIKAILLFCNLS